MSDNKEKIEQKINEVIAEESAKKGYQDGLINEYNSPISIFNLFPSDKTLLADKAYSDAWKVASKMRKD